MLAKTRSVVHRRLGLDCLASCAWFDAVEGSVAGEGFCGVDDFAGLPVGESVRIARVIRGPLRLAGRPFWMDDDSAQGVGSRKPFS